MARDGIRQPRKIIDRKAVKAELTALVEWSGYTPKTQGQVLEIFKTAFRGGWDEIKRRFEAGEATGPETIRANAYLMDQLVRTIHEFALTSVYPAANPTTGEQMAVMATGGYGRGTLAPFSDIDLMFLLPYKLTPHSEQVVEFTLYMLWDLGLKVGHATRNIEETMKLAAEDLTIRTSLLDGRWLWGNQALFKEFQARFQKDLVDASGPQFVDAKLAERDQRHERMGDTRYVLEPNLKEGKGGLRDLQTLFWIAKYLYGADSAEGLRDEGVLTAADVKTFAKAESFLWTVRCHLHYMAGRPEERLTFNVQEDLGKRMHYRARAGARGVERFMKHYFLTAKDVGDLTRVLCAVLEEQHKKRRAPSWLRSLKFGKKEVAGFPVDGGRLTLENAKALKADPVAMLRLFHTAQHNELDIHPKALRLVSQNLKLVDAELRDDAEANRLFLEILTGPEPRTALMWLNEAGVFGRFVPDFGRVVAQMQYDMYHVYTVDEHTIRAIDILDGICSGRLKEDHPVSHSVVAEVQSRRALYVAVLLHDIAKGRGGDHSVLGAEVAEKLGPRFGLTEWETETVAWLVRYHLLMSNIAFKRDLDDAKTIEDFAANVQSPERLRMLLVLTVADIRAVGPGVWNNWKAGLLRELYWRAQEVLSGDAPEARRAERVERAKAHLADRLSDWPAEEVELHLARGHAGYWLGVGTDTLARQANLIRAAEATEDPFRIETFDLGDEAGASEVTVYSPDHPGLFAAIAGAISLSGVSVVDAKINTLSNSMALDTFTILNARGDARARAADMKRLKKRIADAIQGKMRPSKEFAARDGRELPSRTQVFKVPPRVLIDNKASNTHTVIEINGRDRPGFLHDVTQVITVEGLQISSAHISTYGERVVDVFYVKDVFGLKVESENKLATVKARLLDAIAVDGDVPAAAE